MLLNALKACRPLRLYLTKIITAYTKKKLYIYFKFYEWTSANDEFHFLCIRAFVNINIILVFGL
jgi:hypothetical protein